MNKDFWHGKRVFLTGHTGFKGGWLSLWLQHMGAQVTGFALPPNTEPNLFTVAEVGEGMTSIIGDIRDLPALQCAMNQCKPDIVFHLAAQPLVRYSYANPVETYATNVMGTVNLLESVRQCGSIKAVVNVTTDKCYENREWVWGYRENEPMGGFDPYSSSKGCSELVTAAYRNSFFNPKHHTEHGVAIATARAGNVIGGGDWSEDRLIPDIIRAISQNQPVRIRNPHATRPWQHVLEPLSGYLQLAEKLYNKGAEYAEAWNFGPHEEDAKPVEWIVEKTTQLWGDGASWRLDEAKHPHEAHYLKLDISKSYTLLNWSPRLALIQALENTVAWQKCYINGSNLKAICYSQIDEYYLEK